MNTSSESAEQLVRMYIQGVEVAAKLTGSGAKHIAVLLCAILKDQKQTKGKTTLTNMLRTNKELKIFSIKKSDLKKFTEESKRYGVNVMGSEIVGLCPMEALIDTAIYYLGLENFSMDKVLESSLME